MLFSIEEYATHGHFQIFMFSILEPRYILEPDCNTQANHLSESGRQFYDVKYNNPFDNLFSVLEVLQATGDDLVRIFSALCHLGIDW